MPIGCTVLLLDAADREGYAGTALDDAGVTRVARDMGRVWPRRPVLVDRSPYATDARRLQTLALGRYQRVVVARPGACLLPSDALRASFEQATAQGLDIARMAGIGPEICYIASARAIAVAASIGGVPGCVTLPQVLERLEAAGASLEQRSLASGTVSLGQGTGIASIATALSPQAWLASRIDSLLSLPSEARLAEALRLQHHSLGEARARLERLAASATPGTNSATSRVLVVLPSMFQSGAHAAWSELAGHLSPARVAFVVGHGTVLQRQLQARGFTVCAVQDGLRAGSAADAATFIETLDDVRPALVHFDGTESNQWAAVASARGMRVVQHVRLNDAQRFSPAFVYASAVVGVSPPVCREVRLRVGTAVRVEQIPDGVCLTSRPVRSADRFGQSPAERPVGGVVCLCVGRVEPAKGQLRVLDIFRSLRDRIACRLVIVGPCGRDAAYCDEVRDRILADHPSGDVTWEPFRSAMDDLYAQADVVLVGSRNEALGMVGLEALASGALLVAHRSTGYEHIVDPSKKEGLLFEAHDSASDVALRIVDALQDHLTYATNGRRRVEVAFDARQTAARLSRLWDDIAATP
jgi:glycosyltransferase involved in cell wall biosynthesis